MNRSFDLKIINDNLPLEKGNIEFLYSHKFSNGRSFPKSYIHFVQNYGYGLTSNLYLIYIPMDNYCDSWQHQSQIMRSIFDMTIKEEIYVDFEPDGNYELIKAAIPFGKSENGDFLFWDINSNSELDEFDIYITNFKGVGSLRLAKNMYDFIYKISNIDLFPKIQSLLFKRENAPLTFKRFNRLNE